MRKNKIHIIYNLLVLIICSGCADVSKEITNWMLPQANEEIIATKMHTLEYNNIRIALPPSFQEETIQSYTQKVDTLYSKEEIAIERDRLYILQDLEGEFSLFYDQVYGATYTINAIPYMPFNKSEAQYLFNVFAKGIRNSAIKYNITYEKVLAKYSGSINQQIFRTVYRFKNTKNNEEWYATTYCISANNKSVIIQLKTPFQIDFNAYIKKMEL